MKPRIVRKGLNRDGTHRYILQYIKGGKLISKALNPKQLVKMLDTPNDN